MAANAVEDAWLETCLINIAGIALNEIYFAGVTETCDFDFGDKDIEGKPLVNGGRVTVWKTEDDSTVTFEAYPLEAGTTATSAASKGTGFYDLLHAQDNTAPTRILNSRTRLKYRVLFLWTNDPAVTNAAGTTAANMSAMRYGFADGHFTSVKSSFTDGVLKYTVKYKCAAFDKTGASCVLQESCAGASSDTLPAIAAYTTSNKFG